MEFKYDIRDLQFIIKEWLPTEEVFACDRFKDYFSIDDVDMYLNEGYKVARGIVNPINVTGDRVGIKFENGVATSPPGFKEAYNENVGRGLYNPKGVRGGLRARLSYHRRHDNAPD